MFEIESHENKACILEVVLIMVSGSNRAGRQVVTELFLFSKLHYIVERIFQSGHPLVQRS